MGYTIGMSSPHSSPLRWQSEWDYRGAPVTGIEERWGTQAEGFQEGELRGSGAAWHEPLAVDECDHDTSHHGAHHECCRLGRLPVVPAWESDFSILHVRTHGPLHGTPNHEGDDQHHAEGVDPRRGLEEEIVDHERILEEGEIALDTVLPLVCPK
jgi:hypothetical protein